MEGQAEAAASSCFGLAADWCGAINMLVPLEAEKEEEEKQVHPLSSSTM